MTQDSPSQLATPDSQPPSPPSKPRKRGSPKGNTNALKHGFYSRLFRVAEPRPLQELPPVDLTSEIELLRLVIHRLVQRQDEIEDLDQELRYASVLSRAIAQLSRLVRIQAMITPASDPMREAFDAALEDVVNELGLS